MNLIGQFLLPTFSSDQILVLNYTLYQNISKIHFDTFLTDHMINQLPVTQMIAKSRDNHSGHQAIKGIQRVLFYSHFT